MPDSNRRRCCRDDRAEVKQPLAAMITRSETGLRWLDRTIPDLDKAKADFRRIAADGHARGCGDRKHPGALPEGCRVKLADVENLVEEAIGLLQDSLGESSDIGPSSAKRAAAAGKGRQNSAAAGAPQSDHECDRGDGERDGPRVLAVSADIRDGGGVMISVADTGTGIGERTKAGVQSALHDEIRRDGNGPFDLPFDHRGPRRQAVGRAQRTTGLIFQFILGADTTTSGGVGVTPTAEHGWLGRSGEASGYWLLLAGAPGGGRALLGERPVTSFGGKDPLWINYAPHQSLGIGDTIVLYIV